MAQRGEQGRATRNRIVAEATALFAEHGYEGTSIEAVLETADVSRGSLYHHFAGKEALFDAVLLVVERSIGEQIQAAVVAAGASTARDALRVGCLTWVELAGDPVVRRIVLIDAPAVLGWQRWRDIEADAPLGLLRGAMQHASSEGRLDPGLVDVYAHIVLATMNELALYVALAPDQTAAQHVATIAVDDYLERLLPATPVPARRRRRST
jgi:AcrR family transcriptional regulator